VELPDLSLIKGINFLLPGFVAAWVFYGLTAHPKKTPFERAVQALIFTAFVQPLTHGIKHLAYWVHDSRGIDWGPWTPDVSFGVSVGVALLFGLGMSVCANVNFPHGVVPDFITKRTTSPHEWHSALNAEKRWVYLHLKNGRRLYGWPNEWPDHPDSGYFVMDDAAWVLDDNKKVRLFQAHKLLIAASDVEMVEIEKWSGEIAATEEQIQSAIQALVSVQDECEPDGEPKKPTTTSQNVVNGNGKAIVPAGSGTQKPKRRRRRK
jgi:hypothetical protein